MAPKQTIHHPLPSADTELIDKKELCLRLHLPSIRAVDTLMRQRKIPFIRLGYRTVRFSWRKVLQAVERFEHRSVGQAPNDRPF